MIDVCLIYLPKPYLKSPDAQAPLGLMYLASFLEENNKAVEICNFAGYSNDEAIEKLPKARLYGITVTSMEVLQANRFAKRIRGKYAKSNIILGGPGTLAKERTDFNQIDSICLGDGEYSILNALSDAIKGKMRAIYYGKPVSYLDAMPLPARHLLKDKQGGDIFAYGKKYAKGDSTIILSSRGCPCQCAFCTAPALHDKVRLRDAQSVANEMQYVKENFGIKQFRFSDDMFTVNKQRVFDMCDAIGPLDVYWRISCRVKPLDDDMIKAMYQAGCREFSFGIESFDDKVLRGLKKGTTARDNVIALERSMKHGMGTRILMMIRTPFQTSETIANNKFFLSHVPYSIVACTAFIPIPGSDVWNNPDKYNIEILDRDLDKYNFYMFNSEGRRKIDPIIKIKDRDVTEFHRESEEFRDWLVEKGVCNEG